jgi:exodeoxyribonuclease-3
MGLVERFIAEHQPDVLCLQEIKCREAEFPSSAFSKLGYKHIAINAQKGYHGVATLSRSPALDSNRKTFCENEDARHVSMTLAAPGLAGGPLVIHNFYVPAGGDIPDPAVNPKFLHKLAFLDEMDSWCRAENISSGASILCGDLNVAPLETDVWSHRALLSVVSHTAAEVDRLKRIMDNGWIDAVRCLRPEPERVYTWWSYRSPDWLRADKGRRLDHVWLSHHCAALLQQCQIVKEARGWERPSDHVPVVTVLRSADGLSQTVPTRVRPVAI